MTDWQKVRVTFTDAGNNEVSAAMWAGKVEPEGRPDWVHSYVYGDRKFAEGDVSMQIGHKVTMVPIRELPTGVGAVIRVSDYGDYFEGNYGDLRDVYTTDASGLWWSNTDGDVISCESIKHYDWHYEIISEGIQL